MSVRLPRPVGAASSGNQTKNASAIYDVAAAETLWRAVYGRAATAGRIASEVDAVFRMTEPSGEEYLLRITDNRDGTADLQAAVLDHIGATEPNLPVPRIRRSAGGNPVVAVTSVHGDPFAAFSTTFLAGKPLAALASSPEMPNRIFRLLSRLDRSMSGFSHPRAKRSLLWDVSRADQILPLTDAIPVAALRVLAKHAVDDWSTRAAPILPGLPRQVIHNDFNPSNLLVADDGQISGIIDFGDAVEAPRICDLATAIAYQEPAGGFDALIATAVEIYDHNLSLTPEEIAILPILVRARAAMVVAITHWRAAQHPDNQAYLLRNVPLATRLLEAAAQSTAS